MTLLFNPTDVRVAFLEGLVATPAAGVTPFPAPGTVNATRIRYLLGFSIADRSLAGVSLVTVEDQNGNVLGGDPGTRTPPGFCMFINQPILVGIPGQNALQIRNRGTLADNFSAVVWFADVRSPLTPEIFRS